MSATVLIHSPLCATLAPLLGESSSALVDSFAAQLSTPASRLVLIIVGLAIIILCLAALRLAYLRRSLERQRRETKYREHLFASALNTSFDAIYFLEPFRDPNGEVTDFIFRDVNPMGEQLVHLKRSQIVGQKLCELLPINRTAGFFDRYKHVLLTGDPLDEEFQISAEPVGNRWLHHQVVKVNDGIMITSRDVSDSKSSREALIHAERAHAVGQLAAGVIHDFRNLLLAIRANTALVASEIPKDHHAQRSLALIEEAARQGNDVTDAMLQFARRGSAAPGVFSLNTTITRTCDTASKLLPANLKLSCQTAPSECTVLGNAEELKQALLHLILHFKETASSGGVITVAVTSEHLTSQDLPRSPHHCITITAPANSHHNAAADAHNRSRPLGTLPALSIVQAMFEELGATFHGTTTPEGFTTRIFLPIASPLPHAAEIPPPTTETPRGSVAIVIEADPLLRGMFSSMLTQLGYTTHTCPTNDRLRALLDTGIRPHLLFFQQRTQHNTLSALQPTIDTLDPHTLLLVVAEPEATVPASDRIIIVRKPFRRDDLAQAIATHAAQRLQEPTQATI